MLHKYATTFRMQKRIQTRSIRISPFAKPFPHKACLTSCLVFWEISLDVISGMLSLTPLIIFDCFSGCLSPAIKPVHD